MEIRLKTIFTSTVMKLPIYITVDHFIVSAIQLYLLTASAAHPIDAHKLSFAPFVCRVLALLNSIPIYLLMFSCLLAVYCVSGCVLCVLSLIYDMIIIVSVICLVFIAYLFLSEFVSYLSVDVKSSLFVDMPINTKNMDAHTDVIYINTHSQNY